MRTKRFRQIILSLSNVPAALLMESFNGGWKFISGDYSCGVAVLLPVAKHKTAVSLYPVHVFLSPNTKWKWIYPLKESRSFSSLLVFAVKVNSRKVHLGFTRRDARRKTKVVRTYVSELTVPHRSTLQFFSNHSHRNDTCI